jgi:hypothetical protein
MLGNINATLSPTSATGQQNGSTQNLSSNIVATATRGSGNYAYLWNYSGTVVTFTGQTNSETNVSYASLSVAGSSTISCTVTDRTTGVVVNTTNSCAITWPVQLTPITSVTWSIPSNTNSTYNGAAQSVTVVSVVPSGATYSTSTTTATNAGSVASTTINGTGGHIGLAKVYNGGELASPANAPASVTYQISFANNDNTMIADINFGSGWWRFI